MTGAEGAGPVRPVVVVSECLGFAAVRYDGQILRSRFVEALGHHVGFVQTCPEVGIGLGVPRDPIRIVRIEGERRLIQPSTDRDLTREMRDFGRDLLDRVAEADGFILKSKSPSCGIGDAKIMAGAEEGSPTLGRGPGLFAETVKERRPWAAVEDEGRLTNARLRHHFLTKLWALARLRNAEASGEMAELVRFQTEHKLLLMAYGQEGARELGRRVANSERRPFPEVVAGYREALGRVMEAPPEAGNMVNALHHAFGYVSNELERREREHFLGLVTEFREGRLPLPAVLALLRSWTVRFGQDYLDAQRLFEPYPRALFDLDSSGSGRLV